MYGAQSGFTALSGTHYTNFRILSLAGFIPYFSYLIYYLFPFHGFRL